MRWEKLPDRGQAAVGRAWTYLIQVQGDTVTLCRWRHWNDGDAGSPSHGLERRVAADALHTAIRFPVPGRGTVQQGQAVAAGRAVAAAEAYEAGEDVPYRHWRLAGHEEQETVP